MSSFFGEKFLKKKELYPGIKAWYKKAITDGRALKNFRIAAVEVLRPQHIEYNLNAVLRRRIRRGQKAVRARVRAAKS
jgi:hypothetical protein